MIVPCTPLGAHDDGACRMALPHLGVEASSNSKPHILAVDLCDDEFISTPSIITTVIRSKNQKKEVVAKRQG